MHTLRRATVLILLVAARAAVAVEVVSIPSQDGKLKLPGYWYEIATTEPLPAIISLHGCGGLLDEKGRLPAGYVRDADYFNVERIHYLALDSFTPRGFKSICEIPNQQRTVREEDRRDDVFAAIRWLSQQPSVDKRRIAIVGRSHGGQTVLSALDRTDKMVQAQPIQPRAAIAFYPGCAKFERMWNYQISTPLLLMIGSQDDWTPALNCANLTDKIRRSQKEPSVEYVSYPDSYHGFDGTAPVRTRGNLGNTRNGNATVGGNPAAREDSHRRMFDFLSIQFNQPLRLTHDQRFKGHRYELPPASDFAPIDRVSAVPLSEQGRSRYKQYLEQRAPKAFAITEKRGWYLKTDDPQAMRHVLDLCEEAKVKCWLYAVDDRVVWSKDASSRIDTAKLKRNAP
jgi:dienelactone hydrolase